MSIQLLESLRGQLLVSCQAYPGEPMAEPSMMAAVAESVVLGGARAIRAQGLADIAAIRKRVNVPVIGLVKVGHSDVYITPTMNDALAVVRAGADIIAIDGTTRPRPDRRDLAESIRAVHEAGGLVMADCSSLEDAAHSVTAGADCLASTLSGYTGLTRTTGPDLDLISGMAAQFHVPVFAEGRIRTPDDALNCLRRGAHAVVVGSAITHPMRICQRFATAVEQMSTAQSGSTPAP